MRSIVPRLLMLILVAIVIFLVVRFVWQRNEFWYIGPDIESEGYRALMSWLDSWSSYLSWDISSLGQTQQYFKRAIDQNRDTVLGNTLSRNMDKVQERSQLETIQQCVSSVRNIGKTWDDIDTSYNQLFVLLQDQINLVPTVLLSAKNLSTIKCVKNYFDHVKTTSIMLVEVSQARGNEKQSYADEINNYPKQLGSCDKIILIEQQSMKMKQDLADMTYQYNQYRDALNDPVRHQQLCNESYTNSLSGTIAKLKLPTLKDIGTNVQDAITVIKSNMGDVASGTFERVQ